MTHAGSRLRTQFSDAFGTGITVDENLSKETRTGKSRRYAPTVANVAVEDCVFHDITSESNGGAISSTSISRIFIEETTFTTCKTTDSFGGGIYINNGECVISHVCGFDCSSKSPDSSSFTLGQFACIETKADSSSKNYVNESTVTRCKNESKDSFCAVRLCNSNIICSAVNITNNECSSSAALGCNPTAKTNAFTCFIMYTSIVNNSANSGCECIRLENSGSEQLISTSNIINNKQDHKTSTATIYTEANLFINESCIIGNNEGYRVFYVGSSSSQIKITNCTLDSDIMKSTRYYGTVKIIRSKEYSFINPLSHIVTNKCESLYDYIGYLKIEKNSKSLPCIKSCKCRCRQTNNVFLTFLQYLCIISLLPSLSSKHYFDVGVGFHSNDH